MGNLAALGFLHDASLLVGSGIPASFHPLTIDYRLALRPSALRALLRIGEKPLQAAAAHTGECSRRAVGPVEIEEGEAGRIELRTPLEKVFAAAVRTAHGAPGDFESVRSWAIGHGLNASGKGTEQFLHGCSVVRCDFG